MKITWFDGNNSARIGLHEGEAARLLQGLEAQRHELGALAEELIRLLRHAGVKPAGTAVPQPMEQEGPLH